MIKIYEFANQVKSCYLKSGLFSFNICRMTVGRDVGSFSMGFKETDWDTVLYISKPVANSDHCLYNF